MPGPVANSRARAWVNGRPRGLINRRGRSSGTLAASIAAARISARSTMPGPPPAGVSSTLRCLSVADTLMSRASSAQIPDASALPARLTPSGPGNISGNSVRTVARQGERFVIALHRALGVRNQILSAGVDREFVTIRQRRLFAPVFHEFDCLVAAQKLVGASGHVA